MAGFWDALRDLPLRIFAPNVTYVGARSDAVNELVLGGVGHMSVASMWRTQPHLRTVVSFLARNVAHHGLQAFERVSDTDRVRDHESPVAALLRRPNPEMTMHEMLFALVGDKCLYDRAHWYVSQGVDGWIIRRLPPSWVDVEKKNAFAVTEWRVTNPRGESMIIPADQVLTFPGYHPTDPTAGSPTIEALRATLQEQLNGVEYRSQVWRRGGRASAVLERPVNAPRWTQDARDTFREDWYSKFTGSGSRAGGTPILEDGMTLKRIDFTAAEQQYVESAKLSFSTVASAFHVNPTMVGILDNANFSNVREFRRMLYGDTLGPLLAEIEARLNTFLLPMLGMDSAVRYVEFNIGEKLQGSFEEQAKVMQTMVGAPIMSRNEGRARFNLPRIDGGDELITPLNVLVGGQASPTDSAPKSASEALPGSQATPQPALSTVLARQSAVVASKAGAGSRWWDADRWDRELAAALGIDEGLAADMNAKTFEAVRAVLESHRPASSAFTPEHVADLEGMLQ